MIEANIYTYIGQCSEAEHYYCYVNENSIEREKPRTTSSVSSFGNNELMRKITSHLEVLKLNKKDGCVTYKIGDITNRFNSISEIHDELIKKYPNQNIITYFESRIFKEMLYIKDNINLGYNVFGEVFSSVPRSFYKDLVDFSTLKLKCYHCNKEYDLDDISYEFETFDNNGKERTLVKFSFKSDIDDVCDCYDLTWNQIL